MTLLAATRICFIGRFPGLHYDEAWAANFAHRIAFEPGFWPFAAMSPYSSAWGHYWSAGFFRIFWTSLFIYRASGITLVALGAGLISAAFLKMKECRAALFLPWLLAFTPVLATNERFSIDLTSIHVLALGLFLYGSSKLWARERGGALLVTAALGVGVTAHLLFVSVALASILALLMTSRPLTRSLRLAITLSGLGCLLFFVHVDRGIPEKDKALSLIAITLLGLAFTLTPALYLWTGQLLSRPGWRKAAHGLLGLLLVPSGFFLIFLFEGSWNERFFTGEIAHPALIGITLLAPLGILLVARKRRQTLPRGLLYFFAFTLVLTAALAVKPTARYFEIPLVLSVALSALLLSKFSKEIALGLTALWIVTGALQLTCNYAIPLAGHGPRDLDYRFLFFKDSTDDTLDKQALVHDLAHQGCRFEQISTNDPRLAAELEFLSYSDWPASNSDAKCDLGEHLLVGRWARNTDHDSPFRIQPE
jgi:hypothetical protein